LAGLADLYRDLGKLDEAREHIEAALAIVESIRTKVAGQELRASYFAAVQKYYRFLIDLLMRRHKERPDAGFAVAAFEASERARARGLLDLLAETGVNIRQGVEADLLAREAVLKKQLRASSDAQFQLLRGKHSEADASAIAKRLDDLLIEYQQLQAK